MNGMSFWAAWRYFKLRGGVIDIVGNFTSGSGGLVEVAVLEGLEVEASEVVELGVAGKLVR